MEFTIYSVGSSSYLEEILNAVAMITGTGDIESLAKIGFLIGTLFLGFQAVFKNQSIPFHQVGICLILYLAMYGPSGRAIIEDVYDGSVTVVDNVPLGPLVVGSVVSNVGYNMTHLFEQAFSTPSMTSYGFADPIETLMKVRSVTGNLMSIPAFTNGGTANQNLLTSWSNYFRECTLAGMGEDMNVYATIARSNDPMQAARFNSSVYYTQIYDGTVGGRTLNCSDAHTALVSATTSATSDVMDQVATAAFQRPGKVVSGDDVTSRISDSLYALNLSSMDARSFTMASILYPIFQQAPGQKAVEDLQGSYAVMMSQAMAQQSTQWAAEGTMFTKYVRPFMTFFEGLIYAITPLMAFLITMGGFGISLIGKYIMLLAWMMLWMPALSIVNLYTISSTSSVMQGLLGTSSFDSGGSAVSFEMLKQMAPALEQAVGVAGLMASSVPAICLFLVSGTAIAASSIAGRMNGSDQINEKIASPDIISPAPALQTTPFATSDYDKGLRVNGSENQRGDISVGSIMSEGLSSTRTRAEASSESFSKQLTSAYGRQLDSSHSISEQAAVGRGLQSSFGMTNDAGFQAGYDQLRQQGFSSSQIDAGIASVALRGGASATAGVKAGGGPASAGVGVSGGADASNTSQTTRSDNSSSSESASNAVKSVLGERIANSLNRTSGYNLAENFDKSERSGVSQSDQESLSKSAQQTVSDQKAFQQAESFVRSAGYSENFKLDSWAGKFVNENRDDAVVSDAMNKYGSEFQEHQRQLSNTMLDPRRADAAAALMTLAKHGDFEAINGPQVNYDRFSNLKGPVTQNLQADTQHAGHSVNTGSFNRGFDGRKDAAVHGANPGGEFQRLRPLVENDGQAYAQSAIRPAAENAENRIRGLAREVNDRGESSFGALSAISNSVASTLGFRGSREDYQAEGRHLGLNEAQADVFATARVGGLTDNSKERWDQYAASQGMDNDLRDGMYQQLIQAGVHDDGSGGQLADIRTLNQRDSIGDNMKINVARGSQSTYQPPVVDGSVGNNTPDILNHQQTDSIDPQQALRR
ncbi:conjugal transfer protein TraG N-terminal domain-containing protein [Pseudomonas sp. LS-2]|uniref:conjugal transfer protein TraG N-terminal domain-containing protein n=1 Tax=Pseudomonas sp. LS-2 TaxID=2315859 RepID=UPI000E738C48|nr:conjugal transfer protein TraG N-terminal domain-containing protein [Pseudomonas sp. LS-2]RJX72664.1 conjugal transfer protein TraG [Pseudomonas sp. LS-2]